MPAKTELESARILDLVGLSLRVFKVRPFRTAMTILGIGFSFATIFFLLSLGYGLQHILLGQISSEVTLRTIEVTTSNSAAIPLSQNAIDKIKSLSGVEKINPIIATMGQIELGDLLTDTNIESAPDEVLGDVAPKTVQGVLPKDDSDGVAISRGLFALLSPDGKDLMHQMVQVTSFVPIVDDGAQEVKTIEHPTHYQIQAIVDSDQNIIIVPFKKIENLDLPYGLVKVLVKKGQDMDAVRASISAMGFTTSVLADTVAQANEIFKIFQIILACFGLAALIVAIIGMVNTMTISLLERFHEIGIMKVFGITTGDMRKLFYLEASIVGFAGGASGLIMGYIFSQVFNLIVAFLANTLGGKRVDLFYYPIWFIFSILIFSTVVGFLVGVSPARKAAKLDPLKALNFK